MKSHQALSCLCLVKDSSYRILQKLSSWTRSLSCNLYHFFYSHAKEVKMDTDCDSNKSMARKSLVLFCYMKNPRI